jgi:hypothetical protein
LVARESGINVDDLNDLRHTKSPGSQEESGQGLGWHRFAVVSWRKLCVVVFCAGLAN